MKCVVYKYMLYQVVIVFTFNRDHIEMFDLNFGSTCFHALKYDFLEIFTILNLRLCKGYYLSLYLILIKSAMFGATFILGTRVRLP